VRKYNTTNHTYTTITDAVITRMTIDGENVIKVTYTVTDGGVLDEDGSANGTIVDPAGLAVLGSTVSTPATTTTQVPNTGLPTQSVFPALFLIIGGLYMGSRNDKKDNH
jgi:hypothetical protein